LVCLLSDIAHDFDKVHELQTALNKYNEVARAEEEVFGITAQGVTALIFEHWDFDKQLVELINSINKMSFNEESQRLVPIIKVITAATNMLDPLSDESVKKALLLAKEYGYNPDLLKETIETLGE
jgi:HD-like signal output (HDOD) protein